MTPAPAKPSVRTVVAPLIGGESVRETSGGTYDITNPATGAHLCSVSAAGRDELETAVQHATRGFADGAAEWPSMPASERGRILLRAAEIARASARELAELETANVGKPITQGGYDAALIADVLEYWGGATTKIMGDVVPVTDRGLDIALKEPVGVCALITPWNFPGVIATWKLGPALACGNTVIIKPASLTPLSTIRIAEILLEAGLPPDAICVLPGRGADIGDDLVTHPDVAKVSFTGSTEVGARLMRLAAKDITRVSLELGGKSASLVFDDADLDRCVAHSVHAVFGNAGQDCCARSRIFVQRGIYDEFLDRMAAATTALTVGDPMKDETQIGPLISHEQRATALRYVQLGLEEGARHLVGGDIPAVKGGANGAYLNPAVLADVRNDMQVATDEIFGPVASVIPFEIEQDAIRQANQTRYGLSGAVWTRDLQRAIRVTRAMRTGVISVNTFHSVHTEAPFGGYKQSGLGRELGMHAVSLYTELKNVFFADYE